MTMQFSIFHHAGISVAQFLAVYQIRPTNWEPLLESINFNGLDRHGCMEAIHAARNLSNLKHLLSTMQSAGPDA